MWLPDAALERLRRAADEPDLSGTRYEVVEEIGRGGMGTVYRARDLALERDVALKVVTLATETHDGADPPGAAERLLAEARILAELEHPGLVPVHDVGTLPDGRTFYTMKLVRGARLDEHARGLATIGARLRVFERVCEAVAFAHAHGVVHRDLKPANVMVGPFGEVLVLDWGVAKILSDELTRDDGVVVGTPGYMAPEQARGEGAVGTLADVYALGGILYFLLAGTPPPGRIDGVRDRKMIPALAMARDIPAPLVAVCEKALAVGQADRYSSVDALARDVAQFLMGLPVSAYRESVAERVTRFVVKYKTPILLVLAYLLMRMILLVVSSQ
jgi:serine/threonine protein kinase